jgi:hypothetical protein
MPDRRRSWSEVNDSPSTPNSALAASNWQVNDSCPTGSRGPCGSDATRAELTDRQLPRLED